MHGKRTPGWWWSRIELAVAIGTILLIARLALAPGPWVPNGMYWFALSIAAIVVALAGLIWMIRILRGPSDEPPPWRYRR